jgi:hypothetical protein
MNEKEIIETDQPKTEPEKKKISRLVSNVTVKKKSWLDTLAEKFFGDDAKTVGSYLVWDVLIPAAKDTISDMVRTGVDMILFGDHTTSSRDRRDRDHSRISYSSISSRGRSRVPWRDDDRDTRRREPIRVKKKYDFEDIVIQNRDEAQQVLADLNDLIEDYDVATVGEFYEMVGLDSEHVDSKWGWDSLNRVKVIRVRDGFILDLPDPEPLD